MSPASWGRLMNVVSSNPAWLGHAVVTAWREAVASPTHGGRHIRLSPDDKVQVYPLTASAWWIVSGDRDVGPDRFIEVTRPSAATRRLPILDLLAHPDNESYKLMLQQGSPLEGYTVIGSGEPAAGTLVTAFELVTVDAPAFAEEARKSSRLRWIADTVADEEGRFTMDGLDPQTYVLLAVHPRFGRVETTHRNVEPVTLHLQSAAEVVGRVWLAGMPAAGVAIRVVPDRVDLAEAADPIALLTVPATSDRNGRFALALPEQGSADLIIGGGSHPAVRHQLGSVDALPAVTDLGDITLPPYIDVLVRLHAPGCRLDGVGPIGAFGLSRARGSYESTRAAYRLRLPKAGFWWIEATCHGQPRSLLPAVLRIDPDAGSHVYDVVVAPLEEPSTN